MHTIFELNLFVKVADEGSMSSAARCLGITPAAASFALKRLETRLHTRLFTRNTRHQRLTADGENYLKCVRLALSALQEGELALMKAASGDTGTLQLSAPSDFGRNLLLGYLEEFKKIYPNINIQLVLNDEFNNFYRDKIDVALQFGVPPDSTMVALPVFENNYYVACASPSYLSTAGVPSEPEQLQHHACIIHQPIGKPFDSWRFWRDGKMSSIKVDGKYHCDDAEVARRWAVAGNGIIYRNWLDVAMDIKEGRLQALFYGWKGEHVPLYMLSPHRHQISDMIKSLQLTLKKNCYDLSIEATLNPNI